MAGRVPAIYVFAARKKDVDARLRGHDDGRIEKDHGDASR
jgi:hypothetical protein